MYENALQKVGATIRRLREERGFSQEGFAQYAHIDRAWYGRIERGELNISLKKVFLLAGHLGVTPSELLKEVTNAACCGVEE